MAGRIYGRDYYGYSEHGPLARIAFYVCMIYDGKRFWNGRVAILGA